MMKENKITYYILSGFVLLFIAFTVFIWINTQNISSPSTTKPVVMNPEEVKTEEKTNTKAEIIQEDPVLASESEVSPQKDNEKAQQIDVSESVKKNETQAETSESSSTVKNDDWRYEKGEEIEVKANTNKSNITSE
jgi:hypothetical protein